MEYLIGLFLALGVSVFAALTGFDKDRAFYPTVTIVVASYYGLFAVIGGSVHVLLLESIATAAFIGLAICGFRGNLWLVAGALIGHGVFDFFHDHLIENPGMPVWWPMFCLTYDVTAGVCLAWLLQRSRVAACAPRGKSNEHAA